MQVYKVGISVLSIGPLSNKLKSSLIVGPTLWLVSGGSNIPIVMGVMKNINTELSKNLIIALADERYGPYDHPDSNWAQLKQAGLDTKQARVVEVLHPGQSDLATTAQKYSEELASLMHEVNSSVGQFGMGNDGHVAGILPNSEASRDDNKLIDAYQSDPFTRITITFECIRHLSSVFLIAFGESKLDQLSRLINQDLPLNDQPAQIIKQVSESYIYNDQIGGKE